MQLEEKYAFDSQESFPPSSQFPAQALCEASGETSFCEEEPHMQSRPLWTRHHHSCHILTNTLVVLLGQWHWNSEHIPAKHPDEGDRARGQLDQMVPLIPSSRPSLCTGLSGSRFPASRLAQKASGLLFFNCFYSRNISKAIFFF